MPLHEKIQEMYNRVKYHLLTQNEKAEKTTGVLFEPNNVCQYKTPNGLKCAIGALIPDSKYTPVMESLGGLRANDLVKSVLLDEFGINNYEQSEIRDLMESASLLQSIHDKHNCEEWLGKLSDFAQKHRLTDTPMEELENLYGSDSR